MSASDLGISDIPMSILIAAVITSITVPAVWSAYQNLSVNMTVDALENEITGMLDMVRAVMDGGVGSVVEVDLDIKHWGSSEVERVEMGGSMNGSSERFMVSYTITGYGKGFLCLDPPVQMISSGNEGGLALTEGTYRLRLEHGSVEDIELCFLELV